MMLLFDLLGFILDFIGFLGEIGDSVLEGLVEGEVESAEGALLGDGEELLLGELLGGSLPADDLLFERAEAKHMKNETL